MQPARPSDSGAPCDPALDAIAAVACTLEPPFPHERRGVLRYEAAVLVDGLLARVARGRGALDVAIGEALDALSSGDRVLTLGPSGIGDYAREVLGVSASTARKLARLARELRSRPILAAAVRAGAVSARKAETVLPVARGDDEARWVERARHETVRALAEAVREERRSVGSARGDAAASIAEADEPFERISIAMPPEARATVEEALALAGKALGANPPRWKRMEALCQEYLGAFPIDPIDDEAAGLDLFPADERSEWLAAAKAALEAETERWAALERVDAIAAPAPLAGPRSPCDAGAPARVDAAALDARLRELAAMQGAWDEQVGHLGLLLRTLGLWRELCFASLGHYCEERLGMAESTLRQRAALEQRLYELPALRAALRDGRVSYEKARLVARRADASDLEAWISRAERMTCLDLRDAVEGEDAEQMCARGELAVPLPRRVSALVGAAFRAAREAAGEWLPDRECLLRIARHFIETWKLLLAQRSTPHRRILARDRGRCRFPGCSRAAAHAHHVEFRSHGGADVEENLVSLCLVHHLRAIHGGWLRVTGRAPDALVWEVLPATAHPAPPSRAWS